MKIPKRVTDQIDKVFADQSVPPSVTRDRLESIIEYVQEMVDTLPADGEEGGNHNGRDS